MVYQGGDDCIALKPNSTDITIRNVTCYGGTGIAFGSIAQYEGVVGHLFHLRFTLTFRRISSKTSTWKISSCMDPTSAQGSKVFTGNPGSGILMVLHPMAVVVELDGVGMLQSRMSTWKIFGTHLWSRHH